MKAYLSEIFSSVQGEGPYVGERHLFLRFCGCHRDCNYCDTDTGRTETVLVEKVPGSGNFEQIPNPLTVEKLMEIVREKKEKPIRCVRGVYFSAKGFAPEIETFLHQNGVLTTDLETWELKE